MNGVWLTVAATLVPLVTRGTDDPGDPAVVAIVDSSGITECTGTVIGAHFVLTAAHCLVPQIRTGARAVFGSRVASPSASIPIVASVADPAYDPQTLDHDAAILVLGAAAPATPAPMATSAPADGSTLRIVGWGLTAAAAGDAGTKRTGQSRLTGTSAGALSAVPDDSQPCIGDSGGPAFATLAGTEVLAGITSSGDATCQQGASYTRVDVERAAFIEPALASLGDGTVPTGGRCMFPEQCRGGAAACVVAPDDPSVSTCTEGCSDNADCPSRMVCVNVGNSGSQCRYTVPTPGAIGASCKGDADCVDAPCHAGTCSVSCSPVDHTCPVGFACQSSNAIEYYCALPPLAATTGSACALSRGGDGAGCTLLAFGVVAWARRRRRNAAETR